MFGHDDNQDQHQNNNQPSGPPMPDPLVNSPLANKPSVQPDPLNVSGFGTPTPPPHVTEPISGSPADANGLLAIKQQALQQLSPLVTHLEQTPEEKFRTTMMMIQASDDQSLIKTAYEAAQKITDEKARAQALLDVVNEINYFTQQHKK